VEVGVDGNEVGTGVGVAAEGEADAGFGGFDPGSETNEHARESRENASNAIRGI
jgi:hypothetical protein